MSWKEGDIVEGMYSNSAWYTCTIKKVNNDGTYRVYFHDGCDEPRQPGSALRDSFETIVALAKAVHEAVRGGSVSKPKRRYTLQMRVDAKWEDDFYGWYPAKISGLNPDGTFHVLYDDGGVDTKCPAEKIRMAWKSVKEKLRTVEELLNDVVGEGEEIDQNKRARSTSPTPETPSKQSARPRKK